MADGEAVEPVGRDAVLRGVRRLDLGGDGGLVGDLGVDLAAEHVAVELGEQLGQRPVGLGQRGQGVQRGEHAGVGAPEVAEVEVAAVLAAEDGVGLGHRRLDVGVADPGADRRAAELE